MIEINHLVKKYGDHIAVNDLSLNIESGKIYGFLGPNGAGKSTTMNIITGYLGATSGEVKINGFDILAQPEEAKEVMELTKIMDMKDRLIRNLSKGYRQRVGFAQAVIGYPEVIILDEPTVGLDPKQIIEIRELIKKLGEKHTVILSSHILSEISAVCDHIFIISKGKLVASDSTENLTLMMSGAQEIELLVKAEEEAAKEALRTISQVQKYHMTKGNEEGTVKILLSAEKGVDIREAVFFAFADAKLPILEMKAEGKSLEEIFLELTSQKAGAAQRKEQEVVA